MKKQIVNEDIRPVSRKKPLQEPQRFDFEKVVAHYAKDIVRKWADYFLFGKTIAFKQIKKRLK